MVDNFGDGLFLDEDFDFSTSPTGDLSSSSGEDELEKDLAFQMAINLGQYVGEPPSGNIEEKVAGTATRVAREDPRVQSVDKRKTNVSYNFDRKEISVDMTVITEEGVAEMIFNI